MYIQHMCFHGKERKISITKPRLFKYIENFTTKKGQISDKKDSDIFLISSQNIDCRYSLKLPQ